jgi:hypothetical protein
VSNSFELFSLSDDCRQLSLIFRFGETGVLLPAANPIEKLTSLLTFTSWEKRMFPSKGTQLLLPSTRWQAF